MEGVWGEGGVGKGKEVGRSDKGNSVVDEIKMIWERKGGGWGR